MGWMVRFSFFFILLICVILIVFKLEKLLKEKTPNKNHKEKIHHFSIILGNIVELLES